MPSGETASNRGVNFCNDHLKMKFYVENGPNSGSEEMLIPMLM